VNYSDKCVAVFGDSKPFKDKLKTLGAKFNMNLTDPVSGEKVPGWIVAKTKEKELRTLIPTSK
jgi:hypothetical protein